MEAPRSTGPRRRPVADLNLVPYIDLLTCMIAFLLITAVWTQMASLEVHGRGEGGEPAPPATRLAVLVDESGFNVVVDRDRQVVAKRDGRYDFERLEAELRKAKQALPDKDDLEVSSADAVKFETLVRTMDTALAAGFPAISLVGNEPGGL
jgi:biopolymer transport protein ExbD